jgi:hypothetical protein
MKFSHKNPFCLRKQISLKILKFTNLKICKRSRNTKEIEMGKEENIKIKSKSQSIFALPTYPTFVLRIPYMEATKPNGIRTE